MSETTGKLLHPATFAGLAILIGVALGLSGVCQPEPSPPRPPTRAQRALWWLLERPGEEAPTRADEALEWLDEEQGAPGG